MSKQTIEFGDLRETVVNLPVPLQDKIIGACFSKMNGAERKQLAEPRAQRVSPASVQGKADAEVERILASARGTAAAGSQMADADRKIAEAFGLSPEDYAQYADPGQPESSEELVGRWRKEDAEGRARAEEDRVMQGLGISAEDLAEFG